MNIDVECLRQDMLDENQNAFRGGGFGGALRNPLTWSGLIRATFQGGLKKMS